MILFKDRHDAGTQLATALGSYKNNPRALVVALPRGGVVCGFEVARALNLPLDIVVPRKIGAPGNPELAIGAITEDGSTILNQQLIKQIGVPSAYIEQAAARELQEAQRRLRVYRGDRPPREVAGKTVILVDDGIATGYTMQAAIASLKSKNPSQIVVAVPVAPPEILALLRTIATEVYSLATPADFYAIGAFYAEFEQTSDEEVVELLKKATLKGSD